MDKVDIAFRISVNCDDEDVIKRIVAAVRDKYDKSTDINSGVTVSNEGVINVDDAARYSTDGIDIFCRDRCNDEIGIRIDLSHCDRRVDAFTAFEKAFNDVMSSLDIQDSPKAKLDSILKDIEDLKAVVDSDNSKFMALTMLSSKDHTVDTARNLLHGISSKLLQIYEKGKMINE